MVRHALLNLLILDLLKTTPILTKTMIILVATILNIVATRILIVLGAKISNIVTYRLKQMEDNAALHYPP